MCKKEIFLDAPLVGALEKKYVEKAIDSGYVSSIGPFVSKFEEKISNYLNIAGAVAVQSGTSAIYMALYELGIGPGDEVIVPALTFAATVNPVLYVGADPVIVDVDKETWNISPVEIEKYITERTKAIIPVHLYGNPCDMDMIMKIAKKYNLYVIEDATESLGAKYKGKYTGTFGDFGCFSFNGNKLITTGGGGMIVSNNNEKLEHIKYLINQAKDVNNNSFHSEMGFNYRMTNIEAGLGLAQFEQMEFFLRKKKEFNFIYRKEFSKLEAIRFQKEHEDAENSFWLTGIFLKYKLDKQEILDLLQKNQIQVRCVFYPINNFPYLKKYIRNNEKFCVSYDIYNNGFLVPSSVLNTKESIRLAAEKLRIILEKMRNKNEFACFEPGKKK